MEYGMRYRLDVTKIDACYIAMPRTIEDGLAQLRRLAGEIDTVSARLVACKPNENFGGINLGDDAEGNPIGMAFEVAVYRLNISAPWID